MRILMPSRFLDRHVGGNTTYARHLAAGLTERGVEVGRIRAGSHPALSLVYETAAGLQKGREGDILHYVADTGPMLGTRRPTVTTIHGVASRWIKVARKPSQEWTWRTRVQRAAAAADHVITVSNSSADDISDVFNIDRERITTIEHGIDLDRFARQTSMSDELRARLPEKFALYLGNIEPRKNLGELARAFSTPEVRGLGLPLVVAGRVAWNAGDSLKALDESPDVIRLGFVSDDDRTALMQACTVFAFPSLYEGFGFPVVEALAAGAVVLTSNRGSLAEVAGPSIQLPSLEADGIAAGVVTAVTDEHARAACLDEGHAWASRFTWDASVEKHLAVYDKVTR